MRSRTLMVMLTALTMATEIGVAAMVSDEVYLETRQHVLQQERSMRLGAGQEGLTLFRYWFHHVSSVVKVAHYPTSCCCSSSPNCYRLVGLVVKAFASRAQDHGFESRLHKDFFGVESYQWLKNWHPVPVAWRYRVSAGTGWPGVSIYCDWVRCKVWSATSIPVWQHVKLSEQIRPWDTLACCWYVKQPTNNNNPIRSSYPAQGLLPQSLAMK